MKKLLGALGVIFISILLSSCIFGRSARVAMSYRYQKVFLSGSGRQYYNVGALPGTWQRMPTTVHAIAFRNSVTGATIATDAFCGKAYEDLPLRTLTGHMLSGIEKNNIRSQDEFMLDGRGALRTMAKGSVDGVALDFDVVVVKKNRCNIDFMCVAPAGTLSQVVFDFESFFTGFSYE